MIGRLGNERSELASADSPKLNGRSSAASLLCFLCCLFVCGSPSIRFVEVSSACS